MALGEELDGDVVPVRAAARDLADEGALDRGRHTDEDTRPLGLEVLAAKVLAL